MGVNSLPKTVIRQRRGCYSGPSAPESSTLTTRLPGPVLKRLNQPRYCLGVDSGAIKELYFRWGGRSFYGGISQPIEK